MWMVRLFVAGKKPPIGPAHIAGHVSEWVRVRIAGDVTVHRGAHIPDGTPAAALAATMVKSMPGMVAVADRKVEIVDAVPAAAPVAPPPPLESEAERKHKAALYLVDQALRNGWVYHDITGAGDHNDPTELGGRAEDTGLTLAELSLTRPPKDWQELKARGRPPWASHDWTPPHPGWKPPSWPEPPSAMPPEPPNPPAAVDLPSAAAMAAPAAADGPQPVADSEPAAAPRALPTLAPESVSEPTAPRESEAAPDGDPLDSYPAEHRAEAVEIIRDLAKRQKKIPHPNATNFLLDKRGLPRVNKAQTEAALVGFNFTS